MEKHMILAHVDHTLLKQGATWDEILEICKEGMKEKTASVCIPPSFVEKAADFVKGQTKICTVIGFPNGYQTTAVKVFETQDAIDHGADEIDMVINIGWVKENRFQDILQEINAVKEACGEKVLKVIVETCLLTETEKVELCHIVSQSKADYIKTSTGFAGGGATLADITLFAKHMKNGKKIKAAGGIKSIQDAEDFLNAGAERLGSSSLLGMFP